MSSSSMSKKAFILEAGMCTFILFRPCANSPKSIWVARAARGGQGHLVLGGHILPRSEVIRAILLADSPMLWGT